MIQHSICGRYSTTREHQRRKERGKSTSQFIRMIIPLNKTKCTRLEPGSVYFVTGTVVGICLHVSFVLKRTHERSRKLQTLKQLSCICFLICVWNQVICFNKLFPICLLELLALHTDNKDKLRRLICITFTVAMDVYDNFINYPFGCTQTVQWSGNFREYARNFEKQPSLVQMSFIWWWNKSALSEKLTIDTWSLNSGGENRKRVLVVSIFNSLKGLWREHVQMKRNVVSLSCREFCNTNLILLVFSESLQLIRPPAGPKSNSLGWSGWMCVCVCV